VVAHGLYLVAAETEKLNNLHPLKRLFMPHIDLGNQYPGIVGLMVSYPETAKPLNALVETLLRGPHSLTSGEREMIAAYTSLQNDCNFCHQCHAAAATAHLNDGYQVLEAVFANPATAPIPEKMKSLLAIAGKVKESGKAVTAEDIAAAKNNGATDDEIHRTILIAAAFCMLNRYVDGLGTWSSENREAYTDMGSMLANQGYLNALPLQ
jgi:uncharacterized peroxidase-related enzyme